jgi:GGDEF domain-containing protein
MAIKWGSTKATAEPNPEASGIDRCLTLLADGATRGLPEIDPAAYSSFRSNVETLSRGLPDRLPDDEKLALIRSILQEFENYRNSSESYLREQQTCWRGVLSMMQDELFALLGIDTKSPRAAALIQDARRLSSPSEIQDWRNSMDSFLHPASGKSPAEDYAAKLRAADQSTANDNAAGLRGGGAAVEHLKRIMDSGGAGYIVLFRLSCLDIVSQRFGTEAVEDCLMAVSAYLTAGLQGDDAIYHWSDSTLLAILQGRTSELILTAELERIIAQNRESTIQMAGRSVMLRIPVTFDLTPIHQLRSPEDLLRISVRQTPLR